MVLSSKGYVVGLGLVLAYGVGAVNAAGVPKVNCSLLGAVKGAEGEGDSEFEKSDSVQATLGKEVETTLEGKGFNLSVTLTALSPSILPQQGPSDSRDQHGLKGNKGADESEGPYFLDIELSKGDVVSSTVWSPSKTSKGHLSLQIKNTNVWATCLMD